MSERTYSQAIKLAEHYIALGQTTVFIDAKSAPWDKATGVEAGSMYRLGTPVGFWITAEEAGLTLKWSFDLETRDANGRGRHQFAHAQVREIMGRLPAKAQKAMARVLAKEILPEIAKRTKEYREALAHQQENEDFVRELVAAATEAAAA